MTLTMEEMTEGICSLEELKEIAGGVLDAPTVKTVGGPLIVMALDHPREELEAELELLCEDGMGDEDCNLIAQCQRKLSIIAAVCRRWDDYRTAQRN